MTLSVQAVEQLDPSMATVAVFFYDDLECAAEQPLVQAEHLRKLGFKGKANETQRVACDDTLVLVIGLGGRAEASSDTYRRAAGVAVRAAKAAETLALLLP